MAPRKNAQSKKNPASHPEVKNARHELHKARKSARADRQRQANLDRLARTTANRHAIQPNVPLED